jgi:pantetheine-phosphate adenylyltransferase
MKIAIYPGSFDPITNGHIDILNRALKIFDQVILLLAVNPNKNTTFTLEDRKMMLKDIAKTYPSQRVTVDSTDGLTIRYAQSKSAIALVRGLRTVPDFEYEHDIFSGNQLIDANIEMVFFMAKQPHQIISSSLIKQLYLNQVDITSLVPHNVLPYFKKIKTNVKL